MRPAELNRPLVLEEAQNLSDGAGGFQQSWQAIGTLYAAIKPGSGRELAGLDVTVSRVTYRIVVRAAPQGAPSRPKAGQRFRDGARVYHIRAVTEHGPEMRYLVCFAEEEIAS